MSHTKLPWKQRDTTDSHWLREVINENKSSVTWCGVNPIEEAHANAAFICKAANSHYELIAALEEAIAELQSYAVDDSFEGYNNPRFNALLEKAKA